MVEVQSANFRFCAIISTGAVKLRPQRGRITVKAHIWYMFGQFLTLLFKVHSITHPFETVTVSDFINIYGSRSMPKMKLLGPTVLTLQLLTNRLIRRIYIYGCF